MSPPHTAFIALGSNLDDPEDQVRAAAEAIRAHPEIEVVAASALYRTEPLGPAGQPWFVNAVLRVHTSLEPRPLLQALLALEMAQGRTRDAEKWGPRRIDLDLLLYEDRRVSEEGLRLPHPGIPERGFVLVPLHEIAPDWRHPVLGKTVSEMLAAWPGGQEVHRFSEFRF